MVKCKAKGNKNVKGSHLNSFLRLKKETKRERKKNRQIIRSQNKNFFKNIFRQLIIDILLKINCTYHKAHVEINILS